MNIARVHHMGMIVPDLDRAIGGFRDVLGLELDHTEPYGDELRQPDLRTGFGAGEVEAHARAVEPVDRDLVDRRAVGDEVGRRIDVRGRVQAQRYHGVADPVAFEQVQRHEGRLGVSGDRRGLGGQRHRQIHEHRRSSPGRDATVLWPLPAVRLEETG